MSCVLVRLEALQVDTKPVFWADDAATSGHVLRRGAGELRTIL